LAGLLTALVGLIVVYAIYGMNDATNPSARSQGPTDPDYSP
jgi:hypothetical protein